MRRWLTAAVAALGLVTATAAEATHVQTAKVRYRAGYGDGQWYTVNVTFATGMEMNRATRTFDYDGFGKYALIFWGEGQASIIRLEGFFACGQEFTQRCLPSITTMKGEDQEGRAWEVCTLRLCL